MLVFYNYIDLEKTKIVWTRWGGRLQRIAKWVFAADFTVNAHLFCLSYRLSTRAELDPG